MSNEQVAHIAQRTAEIARKYPGENVSIIVVPPLTATSGYLDFGFVVEHTPPMSASQGESRVSVRII